MPLDVQLLLLDEALMSIGPQCFLFAANGRNWYNRWQTGVVPMRQDCKHFESRTYPNGETVRKCDLDLAPEAPWRCPENCPRYEKRLADVNWSHGSLVTPETPDEPLDALDRDDDSVAQLLSEAQSIVNAVGPDVLADVEEGRGGRRRRKRRRRKD